MTQDHETTDQEWEPELTANVPIPIVENGGTSPEAVDLPRILTQMGGERKATRRSLLLILFLVALVAGEAFVYFRLPDVTRLVIYDEPENEYLVDHD